MPNNHNNIIEVDFGNHNKPRNTPNNQINKESKTTDTATTEALILNYLHVLLEANIITYYEKNRIVLALQPLIALSPDFNKEMIEEVRTEMRRENSPYPNEISAEEEKEWETALLLREQPIKDFDYRSAMSHFESTDPTKWESRVVFLEQKFECSIPLVKVPINLINARIYFLIILKMFRLHHEAKKKQAEKFQRIYNDLNDQNKDQD